MSPMKQGSDRNLGALRKSSHSDRKENIEVYSSSKRPVPELPPRPALAARNDMESKTFDYVAPPLNLEPRPEIDIRPTPSVKQQI